MEKFVPHEPLRGTPVFQLMTDFLTALSAPLMGFCGNPLLEAFVSDGE